MGDGSGPSRMALVAFPSTAGRVTRTAAGKRARLAKRSCGRWETPKRGNRCARGRREGGKARRRGGWPRHMLLHDPVLCKKLFPVPL